MASSPAIDERETEGRPPCRCPVAAGLVLASFGGAYWMYRETGSLASLGIAGIGLLIGALMVRLRRRRDAARLTESRPRPA